MAGRMDYCCWRNVVSYFCIMVDFQVFNFLDIAITSEFYSKSVVNIQQQTKFTSFLIILLAGLLVIYSNCFRWTVPYWNKILSSSNINIREHPMSILGCIRVWMSISLTFLVFIFIQYHIILVFDILKSYISELFIKTCNVKFSF